MKKVLSLIAVLCMALVCFVGCDLLSQFTPQTPCEHDWADATCTAPKTCSVCGATDGEPNGHTEETVAGTPATCTEAGKTDGKKCAVCGETTVEQTDIAPLGHTEEIVAGTPATCTEAGKTDGKKCTVCGETTVEQTVIDAFNHKPGADDGDVTTPVKCTNEGCDEILVEAKEAITLTIPAFENGAVVADKFNYAIGDTVKLTINPGFGYAQKLYIDGEPIILDWNNNIYSFVAEKDTYVISGSFEQNLELTPADISRWDTMNQAHGIISTKYLADHNNESWWFDFNGEYDSISVIAKNYLSLEDSKDGDGKTGYSFVLRINLDNDKFYAFRIINDKGTYAFDKFGGGGSATGWGNWQALDSDAATALNGDGVEFKLARTGSNSLTLYVNGSAIFTYVMDGVTSDNKVTSVGLRHYGNIDTQVVIPFALTVPSDETEDENKTVVIGEFLNGAVITDKASYNVGDTVTLTVSPAKDYAQKLYINGEALLVDTNSQYSFVVEEGKTYEISGEFVYVKGDWYWDNNGEFGLLNQAHGVINAPAHPEKDATGELVPTYDKCYGGKVLVTDPFNGTKQDYAIVLKMKFSNGEKAEIRLVNKDGNGHYMVQSMSGIFGSWKWYYDLNDAENAAVANGEGVWFGLVREGTDVKISVNGSVKTRSDTTVNVPEDVVLNEFKVQAYNYDKAVDIKYEFYMYE